MVYQGRESAVGRCWYRVYKALHLHLMKPLTQYDQLLFAMMMYYMVTLSPITLKQTMVCLIYTVLCNLNSLCCLLILIAENAILPMM